MTTVIVFSIKSYFFPLEMPTWKVPKISFFASLHLGPDSSIYNICEHIAMNKWLNWNFLTFETLQPMAGANFASESEYVEWSSISARQFSTRSSAIALSWYSTPLLIEGPVQKIYLLLDSW